MKFRLSQRRGEEEEKEREREEEKEEVNSAQQKTTIVAPDGQLPSQPSPLLLKCPSKSYNHSYYKTCFHIVFNTFGLVTFCFLGTMLERASTTILSIRKNKE